MAASQLHCLNVNVAGAARPTFVTTCYLWLTYATIRVLYPFWVKAFQTDGAPQLSINFQPINDRTSSLTPSTWSVLFPCRNCCAKRLKRQLNKLTTPCRWDVTSLVCMFCDVVVFVFVVGVGVGVGVGVVVGVGIGVVVVVVVVVAVVVHVFAL